MKTYNEMAQSVFTRREKYHAKRKTAIKKSMAIAACCCIVAVLGIWAWHTNAGTSTLPPAAGEQLNNAGTPDRTTGINAGNAGDADATIWLSADEVREAAENDMQQMGVAVPAFVAYEGAIYVCAGEENIENSRYARSDTEVILRKNYSYPAYQVKNTSDHVAIMINGRLEIYQKLFEVKAVIDGNSYRIVQPMMSGIDYSYGEIIQENEDFTVYKAVNVQNGEVMESEYVINILPLLKRERPNWYDGDENYGDAWWVAIPQSND